MQKYASVFPALLCVCVQAFAQHVPARPGASADDVELRLEAKAGKTHYTLGEPIVLELQLRAGAPSYLLTVPWDDQINVTPASGWFRVRGTDHFDVFASQALTDKPTRHQVLVNDTIAFNHAGHYELSMTTSQVTVPGTAAGQARTSNSVVIDIDPPDEAEEAEQVTALMAKIRSSHDDGIACAAAPKLAFLGGDAAIRAKVALLDISSDECPNAFAAILPGLASSRNFPLQMTLLRAAWLNLNRSPSADFLEAMHNTRAFERGEMIPGHRRVAPLKSDPASLRAAQEDARDVDDLIATLPQRSGVNQVDTAYTLLMLIGQNTEQASRVRPYVRRDFSRMNGLQQSMVLAGRQWSSIADPSLVPALKQMLDRPPAQVDGRSEALWRLTELAPQAARPYVIREVCDPQSTIAADKLSGLPDAALPEVDNCLPQILRDWQGPPFLLQQRAQIAARYGSAALLPVVRELYAASSPHDGGFDELYRGALLAHLLRYAPDEAVEHLKALAVGGPDASFSLQQRFFVIGQVFAAAHAQYPAELTRWLQQLSAGSSEELKKWAGDELLRLNSVLAQGPQTSEAKRTQ